MSAQDFNNLKMNFLPCDGTLTPFFKCETLFLLVTQVEILK